MSTTTTVNYKSGGKFCKICKDFGKTETEYRSHNVRERGQPACPTLAGLMCRFCKEKGHTPKFCPKLKERKRLVGEKPRNGNFRQCEAGAATLRALPRDHRASQAGDEDGWEEVKKGAKQRAGADPVVPCEAAPVSARFAALESDEDDCDGVGDRFSTFANGTIQLDKAAMPRLFPAPTGRSWADSDEEEEEGPTWAQRLV